MLTLLLLLSVSKVWSESLDVSTKDHSLRIDTECAKDVTGRSKITVTSDIDLDITVVCRDGFLGKPKAADKVHYLQEVAYSNKDKELCRFDKKSDANVFTVKFYINKMDGKDSASLRKLRHDFILTCTYDESGQSISKDKSISYKSVPFKQHLYDFGGKIKSKITLQLAESSGKIATSPIPLGKTIRLVARVTGPDYVRALTCSATNGAINHTILSAGCGDGIVIPKDQGFKTFGRVVYSPFFSSFRLRGNPSLVFSCKFVACTTGRCDGSSCDRKRTKRDAVEPESLTVESDSVVVEKNQKKPQLVRVNVHADGNGDHKEALNDVDDTAAGQGFAVSESGVSQDEGASAETSAAGGNAGSGISQDESVAESAISQDQINAGSAIAQDEGVAGSAVSQDQASVLSQDEGVSGSVVSQDEGVAGSVVSQDEGNAGSALSQDEGIARPVSQGQGNAGSVVSQDEGVSGPAVSEDEGNSWSESVVPGEEDTDVDSAVDEESVVPEPQEPETDNVSSETNVDEDVNEVEDVPGGDGQDVSSEGAVDEADLNQDGDQPLNEGKLSQDDGSLNQDVSGAPLNQDARLGGNTNQDLPLTEDDSSQDRPDGEVLNQDQPDGEDLNQDQPDGEDLNQDQPDGEDTDGDALNQDQPDGEDLNQDQPDGEDLNQDQPDGEDTDGDALNQDQPDGDLNQDQPDGQDLNQDQPDQPAALNEDLPQENSLNQDQPATLNEDLPGENVLNQDLPDKPATESGNLSNENLLNQDQPASREVQPSPALFKDVGQEASINQESDASSIRGLNQDVPVNGVHKHDDPPVARGALNQDLSEEPESSQGDDGGLDGTSEGDDGDSNESEHLDVSDLPEASVPDSGNSGRSVDVDGVLSEPDSGDVAAENEDGDLLEESLAQDAPQDDAGREREESRVVGSTGQDEGRLETRDESENSNDVADTEASEAGQQSPQEGAPEQEVVPEAEPSAPDGDDSGM